MGTLPAGRHGPLTVRADSTGAASPSTTAATPADPVLSVAELFASYQGEGASLGRPAVFVRLGGCNLACAWCDSAYTWDGRRFDLNHELRPLTASAVIAEVSRLAGERIRRLIVTGGEPLLWRSRLYPLLHWAHHARYTTEIETNGTIRPPEAITPYLHHYRVSPKLAHAGMSDAERINAAALGYFARLPAGRSTFKFVVRATPDDARDADLDAVAALAAAHGINPARVWVMAEGTSAAGQLTGLRALADAVLARGWNLTPRLHTLIWEDRRGV